MLEEFCCGVLVWSGSLLFAFSIFFWGGREVLLIFVQVSR